MGQFKQVPTFELYQLVNRKIEYKNGKCLSFNKYLCFAFKRKQNISLIVRCVDIFIGSWNICRTKNVGRLMRIRVKIRSQNERYLMHVINKRKYMCTQVKLKEKTLKLAIKMCFCVCMKQACVIHVYI